MLKDLSGFKVKNAKAQKGADRVLWGKHGLGVRIGAKSKTWVFRYSFDRRIRQISLGFYPAMSLKEAREEAARFAVKVDKGIDPGAEKAAAKQARKAAPTFKEALDEFYDKELSKSKTGDDRLRLITKDCIKPWGARKIAGIKRRDICVLLDKVEERAPKTRNRLHGALTRLFNFAAERGIIEDSPCTRIKKPAEAPRERVLTDKELKALWLALDLENKEIDLYIVTKLAVKMILLTGQRPVEITSMKWADLDLDNSVWLNPALKREKPGKVTKPLRVPLLPLAIETLEQARVYAGDSSFVFRSSHNDGPIQRASMARGLKRHWEKIGAKSHFTAHDLRRTLRTQLAALNVSDIVAEACLGHSQGGMAKVYNQHKYDKEKRAALEKWEAKLRLIIGFDASKNKVIPFKRR